MISVAMCTFNGEKYIKNHLLSIINQSCPPDELIICDDCSNDETCNIIEVVLSKWSGKWKLIKNSHNLGFRKNFEQAIRNSNGDIIFLSDQDDVWAKNKIEIISSILKKILL